VLWVSRRDTVAVFAAILATLALIWLIYFFLSRYWSVWPPWVTVPLCIVGAVIAIGSPIHTLLRVSDRMLEREVRRQASTAEERDSND